MSDTRAMGRSIPHESARAQVTGSAAYVDDVPEWQGTLHAAPITSRVAHGRLLGVDAREALAMPGVHGVVLAVSAEDLITDAEPVKRAAQIGGAGGPGGRGGAGGRLLVG